MKKIINKIMSFDIGRICAIVGIVFIFISVFIGSRVFSNVGFFLLAFSLAVGLSLALVDFRKGVFNHAKYYKLYPIWGRYRKFAIEDKRKLLKQAIIAYSFLLVIIIFILLRRFGLL